MKESIIQPAKCPRCGGASLAADAPEGLCPRCLGALNLVTETVVAGESRAPLPPLDPTVLAAHFPQLEILECLGRGGMGVVYKARQKSLDRLVALKLLAPEREKDPQFADRFAREAKALASLNHPGIVTIHDFGRAGGFYFLLMEYVDGVNLRQLLHARKLSPAEALAIVPPLCDALQFAHDRGIVHRDIKPENLLLAKDGRIKIADFGIAKMLGLKTTDTGTGIAETQPAGTPGYMAPEQKAGPDEADSRADIYSLGVVFYEMLTGELPGDKIQPPSQRVLIDVRLDEIVLRALATTPELRWQTAAEVRSQVETVLTSPSESPASGGHATRPPSGESNGRPVDGWLGWPAARRRAIFGALAAAAVGLLVCFLWPHRTTENSADGVREYQAYGVGRPWYREARSLLDGSRNRERIVMSARTPAFAAGLAGLVVWSLLVALFGLEERVRRDYPTASVATILPFRKRDEARGWRFGGGWLLFPFLLTGALVHGVMLVIGCMVSILGGAPPVALTLGMTLAWGLVGGGIIAVRGMAGNDDRMPSRVTSPKWALRAIGLAGVLGVCLAFFGFNSPRRPVSAPLALLESRATRPPVLVEGAPAFGPVIEREIADVQPAPPGADEAWARTNAPGLIDFETGKLFLPPAHLRDADLANQKAWMVSEGIDALGAVLQFRGMIGADLVVIPLANADWDHIAPEVIGGRLAAVPKEEVVILRASEPLPNTWGFRTREGGAGLLQLTGVTRERPARLTLRYKLVTGGVQPTASPLPAGSTTYAPAPNPTRIYHEAIELASQGRYEEALQRHIWYHENALKYETGLTGVRLSFALSTWVELGRKYPPARMALVSIRDRDTRKFAAGEGHFALFMDVAAINRELGHDRATVDLLKAVQKQDPRLAKACYPVVEDALVDLHEYEVCYPYVADWEGAFNSLRRIRELEAKSVGASAPDAPLAPREASNQRLVGKLGNLVEILVATGHRDEAEEVQRRAVTLLDDPRTRSLVADAEARVKSKSREVN